VAATWPAVERFANLPINRHITIVEGTAKWSWSKLDVCLRRQRRQLKGHRPPFFRGVEYHYFSLEYHYFFLTSPADWL
jgi:hypothetical protein